MDNFTSRSTDIWDKMNKLRMEIDTLRKEYEKAKRIKTAYSFRIDARVSRSQQCDAGYENIYLSIEKDVVADMMDVLIKRYAEEGNAKLKEFEELKQELIKKP